MQVSIPTPSLTVHASVSYAAPDLLRYENYIIHGDGELRTVPGI